MTAKEFLEKYLALCYESGFCFVSADPYEPIVLSLLDSKSSNFDEVLDDSWLDITLKSFRNEQV